MVDLGKRYRLSPKARIRYERFGGIVYCHRSQKLFLVSSLLMPFLTGTGAETAHEIAQRLRQEGRLPIGVLGKVAEGLERLAEAGVIDEL